MSSVLPFRSVLLACAVIAQGAAAPASASIPPVAPAASAPVAKPAPSATARQVHEGIAIDFTATPVVPKPGALSESDDAVFRFRISDTATGTALSGAAPAAWAEPLPEGETAQHGCSTRVQELLSGSFWSRPEIDLNTYYILTLNDDASISVIDPLSGFGGTKLLDLLSLDAPGFDWVLSADHNRLFVSLPDKDEVAVVDTTVWKVVARIAVGPHPGRVALQPDGAYLWVTTGDGAKPAGSGVAAIDARDPKVVARIATGAGPHDLALADDNRFVYVTNGAAGTVSVVEVAKLAKRRDVALGFAPTSIAFSALAHAAYAVGGAEGKIAAVDGSRGEVVARLKLDPGLGTLRFAPGGRLGFVPNGGHRTVHIFDVSSNREVQSAEVGDGPDQIAFSDTLAYVRLKGSESVMMIPLGQLGAPGKPVPVADFPAGQSPLGQVSRPSPADSIVPAAEPGAVLVANAADHQIYYYDEGMAAPRGSFSSYDREPRAILIVDRSLKERSPGSYETVARLSGAGRFRVAFFLDSPRTAQCFELKVAADPRLEAKRRAMRPLKVEMRLASRTATVGETVHIRFRLTDPNTGKPEPALPDVNVLTFDPAGWHDRSGARALGDGLYEVDLVPPHAGSYSVAIECLSGHLPLHLSPPISLWVSDRPAASTSGTDPARHQNR